MVRISGRPSGSTRIKPVVDRKQAVRPKRLEGFELGGQPPGRSVEVDREVAHQPLDDRAAPPVAFGNPDPARSREAAWRIAARYPGYRYGVLHVALRQGADRRGAEAEQRRGVVRGVALEIAMQTAFPLRDREAVVRQGEVIEPDRHVARFLEPRGGGLELGGALPLASGSAASSIRRWWRFIQGTCA